MPLPLLLAASRSKVCLVDMALEAIQVYCSPDRTSQIPLVLPRRLLLAHARRLDHTRNGSSTKQKSVARTIQSKESTKKESGSLGP